MNEKRRRRVGGHESQNEEWECGGRGTRTLRASDSNKKMAFVWHNTMVVQFRRERERERERMRGCGCERVEIWISTQTTPPISPSFPLPTNRGYLTLYQLLPSNKRHPLFWRAHTATWLADEILQLCSRESAGTEGQFTFDVVVFLLVRLIFQFTTAI